MDLDTQQKIDTMIDQAFDTTVERFNAVETAPANTIFRTMNVEKNNFNSYLNGYINYYSGVFEGIFFTLFLDTFNRMPTPSENAFIYESYDKHFEQLKKMVVVISEKSFKEDNS